MIKEFFKNRLNLFVFLSFFLLFLILNINTPIWSDDWAFYVSYKEERITSLQEFFSSIGYFYQNVNGRVVANATVMLFVYFGKAIFNIFNAIMFALLGLSILFFSRDNNQQCKKDWMFLTIIFSLLWFFIPVPNQTLFWQCGAVVYLWMATLSLFFLIPFKNLLMEEENSFQDYWLTRSLFLFFGILVGNSHEILAPFVVCFLFFVFIKKRKNLPRWFSFGLGGVLLGLVSQFIAPGNFIKFSYVEKGIDFIPFVGRAERILYDIKEQQFWLWVATGLIFLFIIFIKIVKGKIKAVDLLMSLSIFIASGLVLIGMLFPYFPPRAFFFSSIFLIIFIIRFLIISNLIFFRNLIFLFLICFLILSIRDTLQKSFMLASAYRQREDLINQQLIHGDKNIKVPKIRFYDNRMLLNDSLMSSPNNNYWASRFYGVDSIMSE